MSTKLSKYVDQDLDNHLETIFAEMMDEGFTISKKLSHEDYVLDITISRRLTLNVNGFRIEDYENQIKELLDILSRRGIQILQAIFYKNSSAQVKDFESGSTDLRNQDIQSFWDSLRFSIYSSSEYDDITNLTMTFYVK